MFNRTIIDKLRQWSDKKDRKPLVLRGARQVGKTTAINIFAENFDEYLYLNLEKAEQRKIFEDEQAFDEMLNRLFFFFDIKKDVNAKTLIFIDEIQNSPKAIALLRYFYEEANHLYVISAGSLLDNVLDKNISFPVGRVEYMFMHPCTFQEYLGAMGEEQSLNLYNENEIPNYAHDKLSSLFKKYATIGGMPEVLKTFSENQDYKAIESIYGSLITSYKEDVEKYATSASMKQYIRHIISNAFMEAGFEVTFEKFGNSSYRSREMKEAFVNLEKTMLLKLVYPVTSTILPIQPDLNKKPRLHILDTGLVNFSLRIFNELIAEKLLDNVYRGKIAEHIVGQEIVGSNNSWNDALNFWVRNKKGSEAEVDYVIIHEDLLIPIEVKSGASGTLRSLHQFMDSVPHNWAVRFYSGKMQIDAVKTIAGKDYTLINLPHYMAGKINRILDNVIH